MARRRKGAIKMPNMNGTGPYGTGPVGRRLGPCSGNTNSNFQPGMGRGTEMGTEENSGEQEEILAIRTLQDN